MAERTADAADRWQEEMQRNVQRMTNFATMMMNPAPPVVGATPRAEVYRKGKARLYRYASSRTRRIPLLFVPNLGLSRPYIFDLQPGGSFIEYMTGQGFDFYLLDWGQFGPEDRNLTIENCLTRILPRMVRTVLDTSGTGHLSMLGYCMGGTLAASYLGLEPRPEVTTFVNMAGPIDFSRAGLFGLWLDRRYFNVDRVVETFGELPVEMVKAGLKLLKPTMELTSRLSLWWNLWSTDYIDGFKALNHWANDYAPMPGEFFREWVKAFYQENRLIRGELRYAGQAVRLDTIRCPVLAISANDDHIVPADCVQALVGAVGSKDKASLELPGGHISLIAGRSAPVHCWPKVFTWLTKRAS